MTVALIDLAGHPRRAHCQGSFPAELKTVQKVRFEGKTHVPRKELRAVLKTRDPALWPWHDAPLLRVDFLRSDTLALEHVMQQHGYLLATARARLDPGKRRDAQIVTFVLEEGPLHRIGHVELVGLDVVPEAQIRRKLFARTGRPFNPLYLLADTSRIAEQHRERGYLAQLSAEAHVRGDTVDIRYGIVPGRAYHFGQVNLSSPGELHVKPRLILREIVFKPGDVYKGSLVQESMRQIYGTGLFNQVQMTPLPDSTNAEIEYDLRVRERPPRWLDAGVGSGTTERLRFTGEWGHRNLNARGLQSILASKFALDGDAKFLLARAEGTLFDPWFLRARRRGLVSVYYEERHDRANPDYVVKQQARGFGLQLRRESGRFLRLEVTQDNAFVQQQIEYTHALPDAVRDSLNASVPPEYSTHRLQLGVIREARDDVINPFRGSFTSFSAEIAGGPFQGTSSFTRVLAGASWYRPTRRNAVLGTHVRAGAIDPFGKPPPFTPGATDDPVVASVPLEDRFRIGGVNTLRGYNENALPPTGGLALLQGNIELRIPLVGPFGAELFVDAGNVWARASHVKLEDFRPTVSNEPYSDHDVRYVAGAGLRLNLPVGPLRLDVSWSARPDPPERDRGAKTQFAIGPTF